MAEESLITEEARRMVGMESAQETGYAVSKHEIRRYCYAIDDLNPLFTDPDYAAQGPHGNLIAPPLFYSIPFLRDLPLQDIREDGIPIRVSSGLPMPPLKVTRTMGGGTEVEFLCPIKPGDTLTVKQRISDIYEKEGRSGRLVFTVTEATYTNQRGEIVVVERSTNIVR